MKKNALIASIATAGVAASVLVGGVTFAATTAQTTNPGDNLAQAIASKFNLNKDDVKKVIEEQHTNNRNERLSRLVSEGKITEDQKNKIIAKQAEMKPKMEAARAETDETKRKAAMDAIKTEMDAWAKQNGIDVKYLGPGGHGGPGRHGGPEMRGDKPSDASGMKSNSNSQN